MIGNGLKITFGGFLKLTGNSTELSTTLQCLDVNNFQSLVFLSLLSGMEFNKSTGELLFRRTGLLRMIAVLNLVASQASSELIMVCQINNGSGWENITSRKQVLTAIKAQQVIVDGQYNVKSGYKARFFFASNDGNTQFKTEMVGTGEYETELPAAIFNFILFTR